ncbi:MAG: PTS system mannose/fructose/sorbose family transporter subunit IID [Brevinema sp.]
MKNKISKKDLMSVFWRMNFLQASWNYERMQSLAFLFSIKPILQKLYTNKEDRTKAMQRHLKFFNVMPSFAAPILGITIALEEKEGHLGEEFISAMKVSLMGPLSGLGDSIVWLTWMPICMSIAASFGAQGNPIGLILGFIAFNILNMGIKYYGIREAYSKGVEFLNKSENKNQIQRYTQIANILGLVLIGGLVPQMVTLNVPYIIQVDELKIVIQEILDGIFPNLLPILLVLTCYSLIKKGTNTLLILLALIVLSIVGTSLGIIG